MKIQQLIYIFSQTHDFWNAIAGRFEMHAFL